MASGTRVNQDERFVKLLDSLLGLHITNARPKHWVNDRLQAIIDEPNPLKLHHQFWERQFPGSGEIVLEEFALFLNHQRGFKPSSSTSPVKLPQFLQRELRVNPCALRCRPEEIYSSVVDGILSYHSLSKPSRNERADGAWRYFSGAGEGLSKLIWVKFHTLSRDSIATIELVKTGLFDSMFLLAASWETDKLPAALELAALWREGHFPIGMNSGDLILMVSEKEPG